MSLSPGTWLGSYEAAALIGAGGLGAVYPRSARARSRLRSARPRIITGLRLLCVLAALGQFFLPDLAHAQDGSALQSDAAEPAVPEKVGKALRAFRITDGAPRVDGRLDEEVWGVADAIADFVQEEPDNMAPPTERTVIQIAYDDRYIYVAVRCYDREPSLITAGLGRRDNFPPTDRISIGFDPRHDHLTAYVFETNPSGVQGDFAFFDDTRTNVDYDGVWEVGTQVTPEGWTAEFQIAFSQMRFDVAPGDEMVWGFNVVRNLYRRAEVDGWVATPRGEQGVVSRFGHLVFGDRLSPPRRVELLPFTFVRREDLATASPEHAVDGGLDLRLGLGTSATLSATINPDFAQVELDPAVLNLTVFESFFPEKRPFFLEDSRTFVPPYGNFPLFHSRRIGRRPDRFSLEAGDRLVERPDQTTILGAAKVTGKTSTWTYGALTAVTAREYATVDAVTVDGAGTETVTRADRLIEPRTSYNVARVQRDIRGGSSNVGAIATAVVRERDQDAFTGGVDYNIRWSRNLFAWNGHWVGTRAPFADGKRTGFGGVTRFNYFGKYVGVLGFFRHKGRNFRNTDLGFTRGRVDETIVAPRVTLRQPDPWGIFRRVSGFVVGSRQWNRDGLVFVRNVIAGSSMQFRNFWTVDANVRRHFRALDDLDTRGGPPIVTPAATFLNLNVGSDSRKTWQLFVGLNGGRDEEGGWNAGIGPGLDLQPSARLQTSLSANYSVGQDVAQWITNRDVNGDGETDHVYGRLRRDVIDVTARATYAFHRDMTLEVFLQPFVAVGEYSDIRRLARPSSFEFGPATIPFDPDFNRKSLRGNIVLRWEYLRGSTLFVVWNMSTFDDARPGVFSPLQDLGSAFGADGTHVFMVKMNYWFSP